MGDSKAFHDPGGNDLIKGLLAERIAAAFYQAKFPVHDLPSFFDV